jgi:GAF domain-containing protein
MPASAVTVVGQYYHHFKVSTGVTVKFVPREQSICAYTILQEEPLIVPDLCLDVRFCDHPFVVGPPQLRFYAGVPLRTLTGHRLGAVCVMDVKPRTLAPHEQIRLVKAADTITQILRRQQAVTKAARLRRSIASEMHRGDVGRVRQLRDQLSEALMQQFRWRFPVDPPVVFAK